MSERRIDIPLTASDLREIAKVVDSVERKFGFDEDMGGKGLTAFGAQFTDFVLTVCRPGDEEPVGQVVYYDGWIGFLPFGGVS
jgi:hypothetical protein